MEHYYALNRYLMETFGEKVYKLALDGGMTCPNRDGTLDTRGCIFCSQGGSGDFAQMQCGNVHEQIQSAKSRIVQKTNAKKFIAYYQSYTNTYAEFPYLKRLYTDTLKEPDIVALSIGTRPDCLSDEIVRLLSDLNRIKPVWVELGLQTIHSKTAHYIRRGYELPVFVDALHRLQKEGIHVVAHVILGLPGESKEDMLGTIRFLAHEHRPDGIKLQLLHVLEGTDLAQEYAEGKFETMEMDAYFDVLFACIEELPEDMVIHRLTGDGPKRILIAPKWTGDKKRVMNEMRRRMDEMHIRQGKNWKNEYT